MEYPPPPKKRVHSLKLIPHTTQIGIVLLKIFHLYDIKNLVVETLKPKQPDDKGNFNFHGPDLLQKNILVCICTY